MGKQFSAFIHAALIAILVSTSLLVSTPNQSFAAPSGQRLSGPTVQSIPLAESRPLLSFAVYQVEQGYINQANACRFSLSFEAQAGDLTPQFAAVTAVDTTTCEFEVLRGIPDMASLAGGDGEFDEDHSSTGSTSTGNSATVMGAYDQRARFSTYWEDPVNLDVNKVSSSVRTYTSGAYITGADCSNRRYKLTNTGWYELGYSYVFLCEHGSDGSWARSYLEAGFANDSFCPTSSTYADYFGNIAYATPYAISGWINQTYVYGGCTGLLSGPYTIFEPGVY